MRNFIFCLGLLFQLTMGISQNLKKDSSLMYLIKKSITPNPHLLIFLHGLGSNEEDLFELASHFPDNYTIISLRAPYSWGNGGYSWYDLQFDKSNKAISNLNQAETSRLNIIYFIEEIKNKEEHKFTKVYLLGFSQGAIMSYNVALTRPDLVNGVIALSGYLMNEIKPKIAKHPKLKLLDFYIAHGKNDNIIEVSKAKSAVQYLKTLKITPKYKEYNEDHSINFSMLNDLKIWLRKK
ncbi:MAG: alpha/beta fold hydrolase [Saprospiraceae bacterium]|nr:alpha/beta fold hydrolase [Saprospiraceae bacterium]